MSSSLISLSFKDREEDSVCSSGYSRAPRGIRVSSGTQEGEEERDRETDTQEERERAGERQEKDTGKQIEGHVQGSTEEE